MSPPVPILVEDEAQEEDEPQWEEEKVLSGGARGSEEEEEEDIEWEEERPVAAPVEKSIMLERLARAFKETEAREEKTPSGRGPAHVVDLSHSPPPKQKVTPIQLREDEEEVLSPVFERVGVVTVEKKDGDEVEKRKMTRKEKEGEKVEEVGGEERREEEEDEDIKKGKEVDGDEWEREEEELERELEQDLREQEEQDVREDQELEEQKENDAWEVAEKKEEEEQGEQEMEMDAEEEHVPDVDAMDQGDYGPLLGEISSENEVRDDRVPHELSSDLGEEGRTPRPDGIHPFFEGDEGVRPEHGLLTPPNSPCILCSSHTFSAIREVLERQNILLDTLAQKKVQQGRTLT